MSPELEVVCVSRRLGSMKISEKIKHLFRQQPPAQEQLAARAAAEAQASIERGKADIATEASRGTVPPGF
jgi:hypothetical protein